LPAKPKFLIRETATLQLLVDYEQAASALSLSRAALRDLVYKGRGPVVTKIGRRTLFAVSDLQAFVAQHRQAPQLPPEQDPVSPPLEARSSDTW
jgi:hypothetical protein